MYCMGTTGEDLAAEIIEAIKSGRDVYVFDRYIGGPGRLERDHLEDARTVLIEKRDACSEPDEACFLTSIIAGLEKALKC